MSALEGFEDASGVPDIMAPVSRYRAIIEEFMASGKAIMVRDMGYKGDAAKLAAGINQYNRGQCTHRRTEDGYEKVWPWPGFRCIKRGTCVYLINGNLAGGDAE